MSEEALDPLKTKQGQSKPCDVVDMWMPLAMVLLTLPLLCDDDGGNVVGSDVGGKGQLPLLSLLALHLIVILTPEPENVPEGRWD